MRSRIVVALCLSAILIVGAGVFKAKAGKSGVGITGVESPAYDYFANSPPLTDALGETSEQAEDLTATDLLGRYLISDYVNLATQGEATDESVQALAEKYLELVPSLSQSSFVTITEIKIIQSSTGNLAEYRDSLMDIRYELGDDLNELEGDVSEGEADQEIYAVASKIASAYEEAARSIRTLPVPNVLSDVHLKLVNNYFSTASAFAAVGRTDSDSASAFAGLITLGESLDKEEAIYMEISRVLIEHGV